MTNAFVQSQLDAYAAAAPTRPGRRLRWLDEIREGSRAAFAAGGLPTARDEQWKYTQLRALEKRALGPDPNAATRPIDATTLDLPGTGAARLVFVNGAFRADLSRTDAAEGLTLLSLADALERGDTGLEFFLSRRFRASAEGFAQLNTALAHDGAVVRVAAGARIAAPLHVVHVGAPGDAAIAWHVRNLIELAEGATLMLVEHYVGAGAHDGVGNVVSQVGLAAGAELTLVRVNDESDQATLIARTEAKLADGATLKAWSLDLGAALARHDFGVELAGPRARLASRGVFASRGRQHVDTRLDIHHVARDTASDLVWRGVADQRARGVFHGSIRVAAGADGTDAALSNKNLLLSPHAEIDTQPALEIYADEVKASHGATVGQLDERALFYLRSRGVPVAEARSMLTFAFCRAVLDDVPEKALREHLAALLIAHLPRHDGAPA